MNLGHMRLGTLARTGVALVLTLAVAATARAATIDINFNTLAEGASNSSVQTYMNGVISSVIPGASVMVSGSKASKSYNGDNHVISGTSTSNVSRTLGTTDYGVDHGAPNDTFLMTTTSSTEIVMTFTNLSIYSVSFDYEIFPDATCPNGTLGCGTNWPDFKFQTNLTATPIFTTLGVTPVDPNDRSPASNSERAPQYLGQSGTVIVDGATTLRFIDWPVAIGIDNLRLTTTTVTQVGTVPEPATMSLLGAGLAALYLRKRRKTQS
jgi:hypothetical protein